MNRNDQPIPVLLVDDDEDDFIMVWDMLSDIPTGRFHLDWVDTYEAAQEAIARQEHQLYLLDYRLEARNGLELLQEAIALGCTAPLILLTGQGDHEIDMEAMQAGAADYLVKGQLTAPLLERSIRYALERTRALAALRQREEQLRQSQKMEVVGRLAGGIAHDFNNILTAISGYADLMLTQIGEDGSLRRGLTEITKASDRAARLVDQLLNVSRKRIRKPTVLNLNTVVSDMKKMLQRLIGEDVELATVLDPELGSVRVDRNQLEQTLLNLAINARDAMPEGGRLMIRTANVPDPEAHPHLGEDVVGPQTLLTVSDTGCGMDEEARSHLFEPFFTTKEQGKGTGLGLYTVYSIVQQSGGTITVQSEPEQGTTFRISLPRVPAATEPAAATKPAAAPVPGTETILLAEDEEAVRNLLRQIIEGNGYRVLTAANGQEAITISQRHPGPIHLLVTDVVMPKMSGPELTRRVTAHRPDLPVLYISGHTDNPILLKEVLEAKVHFLQKPFTPGSLTHKMREILTP